MTMTGCFTSNGHSERARLNPWVSLTLYPQYNPPLSRGWQGLTASRTASEKPRGEGGGEERRRRRWDQFGSGIETRIFGVGTLHFIRQKLGRTKKTRFKNKGREGKQCFFVKKKTREIKRRVKNGERSTHFCIVFLIQLPFQSSAKRERGRGREPHLAPCWHLAPPPLPLSLLDPPGWPGG